MLRRLRDRIWNSITNWLTREAPQEDLPPSDFDRLRYEIRFCDVLLVEGRSRVSAIIQSLTLSPWTHAALYIGRLHAIDDPDLRKLIQKHYPAEPDEQLIIEALLGQGTIVAPLSKYRNEHVRICRPTGISRKDAQAVIAYAASRLGTEYDVRQLLDLARFLFPYRLLPGRWRSSLFGKTTSAKTVCSTMLAGAFASIRFPVRPVLQKTDKNELKVYDRNLKLYTPMDFDYSPYFEIIKYPIFGIESPEIYRRLPWDEYGVSLEPEQKTVPQLTAKESPLIPPNGKTTVDPAKLLPYDDEGAGEEITQEEEEISQEAKEILEEVEPSQRS